MDLSFNKICFGYQLGINNSLFFLETYFGLSNQDINEEFDDILFGIGIGLPFYAFGNSNIYGEINTGLYIPNNVYYNTVIPFAGVDIGYEISLGKAGRHLISAEVGYIFGKREYLQTFSNNQISVSSIDTFELFPICFEIGYGFSF